MGSVITSKKGLLKLVNGQINIEVDGSKQPAKDGEQLPKGAVLHIGENATYEITFDDGTKLSNEAAPAITAATPTNAEATPDEIQALQDLIASGEDPTKNLPETAAGNAPASDGNSGYVSLARDGAEAIATSGYSTSGQTLAAIASNTPDQSIATDSPSVLANDSITVDEDTVATGNVLNNDTDADTILSVVSFSVDGTSFAAGSTVTLEGGSLVINADGSYTFTPNENWNGQVPVITYTTNTGSTATLTINITPVDDPSVLANDTNTVDENTVATGNVLDNDSDVDNELSVTSFTVNGQTVAAGTTVTLEGGSLVINADGSYTFTPNEFWNGQVPVITYTTNTGSTATLTINITPVANGGPSVTIITDTNNDGFISNEELGGATEVNVTIGLEGTGANAGDTLTVNGVDYILTQEDIDNGFVNLTLPAPAEGETITVVATITDAAGNTSPEGSDSAVLDTTGPVITVSAPDDTQDTTPTITGTTDAPPGSTITIVVTDSTGAQQTLTTTVNPDGTYVVDVTNPIAEGGYTAEASVTDPAGNTGKASDNGSVDTQIDQDGDGNTVAITAITEDTGSSSSDFITNDNTLIFKGTVDLDDNSTLAVTINGVVYTTANGLVIDAQGNWSVDLTGTVLPDGTYPVSATVTDAAGNSKTVTQDVVIDTQSAAAPTVTIDEDLNNDGFINPAELTGPVNITVTVGLGTSIGDLLIVTDQAGNTLFNGLVTQEILNNGLKLGIIAPAIGTNLVITAVVTDQAGNSTSGQDQARLTDSADDSKTVVEDTVASGNVLTNDEAGNTSVVSFTVAGSSVVHNAGSSVVLTGGTLVLNSNGSYSFTPNANWNGAVPVITYTTNTGATATLTITVTPDNTDAANDSKTVVEDTVASGNVLTNDEAGNTSVVSFTVAGSSVVHNAGSSVVLAGGTLVLNSNGSYSFTPNANWNGAVPVITYTTNTGATATLTITVTPADDPVTIINTVGPLNVYESALANGTGNPSTGQTSAQGSMSITANDGLNRIEVTNSVGITSTLTLATLLSASLTSPIVIAGANGTLYITGYSNGQLQYTYTLTQAQTHSTQGSDTLNDNFQVKAIDTDGDFATTTITTTVHDDVATAHNDTDQLEVVLDSFNFSGIVANWTTINGGSDVRKFDGPDNDSGKDQVRWGDPASYNGSQSGYGFADNDAALNGSLSLNQDIVLGTFTHYNYPIDSGTSITSATMQITFNVTDAYGVTTPVTLTLNFSHNETPNDGPDPRDIVTVGQTSVTFNYEGQVYTMQVIGFKDSNGNIVTSIYTNENDATSYQLVVRMVAGNGYTLPHTDGNVLTNDTTGADTAVTVIGVANGDHTNTGVSGHVGTTINGLYGTLILYADGTYHYQLTASADQIPASGATETFTYTMQDGDGDRSSATLKINVSPVNADGVNLVDANAFTTQGSSLNDTIVVTNGENSSNHNRLNVTFGGGLSGIITNSNGQEVVSSGANKKSYSTTDAQVVSGGDGNDHIETGKGDDVIYAGKTGAIGYGTDDQLELSVSALSTHHIMTGTLSGTNSIVDSDGLLLANDVASQRADVVNGGSGNDRIYGQSGSDILYGHTGDDYIDGGSHNDALRGGAGNDTLIGGLGDDVLRGDSGNDTFVWRYADADKGTDHIMDFNVSEDKLDLSDLLQGETAGTLESYLNFSLDSNGSTVIDIDANKDGVFDQHIVLDGVNLYSQYGATDNAGIINGLLGTNGNGPLIIDAAPVTPDAPQGVTPLIDPHNNGTMIP